MVQRLILYTVVVLLISRCSIPNSAKNSAHALVCFRCIPSEQNQFCTGKFSSQDTEAAGQYGKCLTYRAHFKTSNTVSRMYAGDRTNFSEWAPDVLQDGAEAKDNACHLVDIDSDHTYHAIREYGLGKIIKQLLRGVESALGASLLLKAMEICSCSNKDLCNNEADSNEMSLLPTNLPPPSSQSLTTTSTTTTTTATTTTPGPVATTTTLSTFLPTTAASIPTTKRPSKNKARRPKFTTAPPIFVWDQYRFEHECKKIFRCDDDMESGWFPRSCWPAALCSVGVFLLLQLFGFFMFKVVNYLVKRRRRQSDYTYPRDQAEQQEYDEEAAIDD